jgi:hypothetical protein
MLVGADFDSSLTTLQCSGNTRDCGTSAEQVMLQREVQWCAKYGLRGTAMAYSKVTIPDGRVSSNIRL